LIAASVFGVLPEGKLQATTSFTFAFVLQASATKALCLLSYFHQFCLSSEAFADEVVSFTRRATPDLHSAFWQSLDKPLQQLDQAPSRDLFNDMPEDRPFLHADFANCELGGGALLGGDVQEEIMFARQPECYVGMLLCKTMRPNEAIIIAGSLIYSTHTGWGKLFRFGRPYLRDYGFPADGHNRRGTHVAAMDALCKPGDSQYIEKQVLRELQKAYTACLGDPHEDTAARAFATGGWGCGQFGGDPQLKALIQWLAASAAGRSMLYFPGENDNELHALAAEILARGCGCKELYGFILRACKGQRANGFFAAVRQLL
jgi:poly(ADP-ribose) glycohydrolase